MVGPKTIVIATLVLAAACSEDSPSTPIDAPSDGVTDAPDVDAPDSGSPLDAASDGPVIDAPIDAIPVDTPIDAIPVDADPDAVPPPLAFFVADRLLVPQHANEAFTYGLDLDGIPNDGIDNQLGQLLGSLGTIAPPLSFASAMTEQVDRGQILLLATMPMVSAGAAAVSFYPGSNPVPPACASAADTICRRHLLGTGAFDVAVGAPTDSVIPGTITASVFRGGPGQMVLPIALTNGDHVDLPLHRAKAELVISPSGFGVGSKIGGAITDADVDNLLVPRLHGMFVALVAADCPPPGSPPWCNCALGSSGETALNFLDIDSDCTISVAEVQTTFDQLLVNDIDLDGNGVRDAVSVGVGIRAVAASFAPPAP